MQLELNLTKPNVNMENLSKRLKKSGWKDINFCVIYIAEKKVAFGQIFTILLGKNILLLNLHLDTEKKVSMT